jgi:hypothetical protein
MLNNQSVTQDVAQCNQPESVTIEILRSDTALDGNLPSTFFPGAGSDGALFQVIASAQPFPSYGCICGALNQWDGDTMLMRYDEHTGEGYFRLVDSDAPESGSVIALPFLPALDDGYWVELLGREIDEPNAHYVDPKEAREELTDFLIIQKIDRMCSSAIEEIDLLCVQALQRIESITLYQH